MTTSTPVNVPVVNGIYPYLYGAHISWTSVTSLTIQPALVRDSTNTIDMNLGDWGGANSNTVLNGATNGANGLDTGSLTTNTWYAVFVIGSSLNAATTATLISLSVTSPTLPANYDAFRRIGWVRTNGSSQFIKFYQSGTNDKQYYQWDSAINVLNGGTATGFTTINLSSAMPPQIFAVYLNISYTPALAANQASIRPTGSTGGSGTTPLVLKGTADGVQIKYPTTLIVPLFYLGNPSIEYEVISGDSLSINVAGFQDFTS